MDLLYILCTIHRKYFAWHGLHSCLTTLSFWSISFIFRLDLRLIIVVTNYWKCCSVSLLAKMEGKVMPPTVFFLGLARNSFMLLYTIVIGLLIFLCMPYIFSFSYLTNALQRICLSQTSLMHIVRLRVVIVRGKKRKDSP
jgi:hypothetical protein